MTTQPPNDDAAFHPDDAHVPQDHPQFPQPQQPLDATPVASPAPVEAPWQRLNKLVIVKSVLDDAWQIILVIVGFIFFGAQDDGPPGFLWFIAFGVIGSLAVSIMQVLSVRFRVADGVLEKKQGLLSKEHSKMKITLIRSVSETRTFADRVLGLATLKAVTGSDGDSFAVEGLTKKVADELRTTIDAQRAHADDVAVPGAVEPAPAAADVAQNATGTPPPSVRPAAEPEVLAKFSPGWVFRGAISGPGLFPILAIFGVLFSFGSDQAFKVLAMLQPYDGWAEDKAEEIAGVAARNAVDSIGFADILQAVAMLLAVLALVLVPLHYVGNAISYVIKHYGFTLRRTNPVTLESSEGLFSTKTFSINTERMRGATIVDGVLTRQLKVSQVDAILTVGVLEELKDQSRLLPRVPQQVAHRVVDQVLPTPSLWQTPLVQHGPKALRRLLIGAVIGAFWVAVPTAWAMWHWQLPAVVALVPVLALGLNLVNAVMLYRHRGHAVLERDFVVRDGFWSRSRKMATKDVTIGLEFTANPFQRRLGVTTLRVMDTGSGYSMADLTVARAEDVADQIAPALVQQFVQDATR